MVKIDGKKIAEKIKNEVKDLILEKGKKNLVIFYIGQNNVIDSYVNLKKKVGEELGIYVEVKNFPENIDQETIEESIKENIKNFSGAIIQLPIPHHLDKDKIINLIPPEKDVDVLAQDSIELFKLNKNKKIPTVASAICEICNFYNFDFKDKKVLVIGRGSLVGKPVSNWLNSIKIYHEIIDSETPEKEYKIKNADVIISGIGVPGFIKKDMVKKGVILIDAGTSTSSGKIAGDIDPGCYEYSSFYTPVPGGVGPITVISLFKNLFL